MVCERPLTDVQMQALKVRLFADLALFDDTCPVSWPQSLLHFSPLMSWHAQSPHPSAHSKLISNKNECLSSAGDRDVQHLGI